MRLRAKLDKRLNKIENRLIKMGSIVEKVIYTSFEALSKDDDKKAISVIEMDKTIDQLETEIERECVNILALQQPIASDLREVTGIMKIIIDLERMGDLATNIAKIQLTNKNINRNHFVVLDEMEETVKSLLRESLDSFVNKDVELARNVAKRDNDLDDYFKKIYDESLDNLHKETYTKNDIVPLLFVGRYLERMGDHVTNICERVIYMVDGLRESY